jgi:hypothetical protein
MSQVTSTNIRVGPGIYLMLKRLADNSNLSMGTWANLLIAIALSASGDMFSKLPPDILSAVAADALSAMGDLLKIAGLEVVKSSGIAELYQKLLNQSKAEYVS